MGEKILLVICSEILSELMNLSNNCFYPMRSTYYTHLTLCFDSNIGKSFVTLLVNNFQIKQNILSSVPVVELSKKRKQKLHVI